MKNKYSHEHDAKITLSVCAHNIVFSLFSYHHRLFDIHQRKCFSGATYRHKAMHAAQVTTPKKHYFRDACNVLIIKMIPPRF